MEAPEQHVTGSHSSSSTGESPSTHPSVAKRKRTKRQRAPSSPPPPPPQPRPPAAASSSTSSASAATEEEEDMAHCLILLAQGRSPPPPAEKFTSRRFTEAAATAGGGKAGFYVYECKTCSKCFPSFQALGGHRASHKKPKMTSVLPTAAYADEKIAADAHREPTVAFAAPTLAGSPTSGRLPPPAAAAARVHECSICGAEFSSGQALGGHMRRHRPIGAAPTLPPQLAEPPPSPSQEVNKERNLLSLDLNLPAPADDNSPPQPPPPAFTFADKRPMVFSALVDCHY